MISYIVSNLYSQTKLISKNTNISLLLVTLVSTDQESKKENWSKTICCKEDKQTRKRNSYQLGNISRMRNRTRNSLEQCCLEGIFYILILFLHSNALKEITDSTDIFPDHSRCSVKDWMQDIWTFYESKSFVYAICLLLSMLDYMIF